MTDREPAPPTEVVATTSGPIAVRRCPVRGPGPHDPAVMIHGLSGSSLHWTDLGRTMADRLESAALDLPGCGSSPPAASGDYTLAAQTEAAAAACSALFPGRPVHLFGNSMGGLIAVHLAVQRPELVRTLTLVSPALPDRKVRSAHLVIPLVGLAASGPAALDRAGLRRVELGLAESVALADADPSRVPADRMAEIEAQAREREQFPWASAVLQASARGLVAALTESGAKRPWAMARKVRVPVLVVYGGEDRLIHSRAAGRAGKTFRGGAVVVLPDCGHLAMLEQPEQVWGMWQQFIGRQV